MTSRQLLFSTTTKSNTTLSVEMSASKRCCYKLFAGYVLYTILQLLFYFVREISPNLFCVNLLLFCRNYPRFHEQNEMRWCRHTWRMICLAVHARVLTGLAAHAHTYDDSNIKTKLYFNKCICCIIASRPQSATTTIQRSCAAIYHTSAQCLFISQCRSVPYIGFQPTLKWINIWPPRSR